MLKLATIGALAMMGSLAQAQYNPANFTFDGTLFQPNGTPVTSASVPIKIEIYDQSATCVLYSENHNVDLSQTNGSFSIRIGNGSSAINNLESNTSFSPRIFENSGATGAFPSCGAGVTNAAGNSRKLRVQFDPGGGYVTLTPDYQLSSVPTALVADTLQGIGPSSLLRVRDDASYDLNQTNVETVFSTTNYPKLTSLLGGNFGNQTITNVGAPSVGTDAVNKTYADTKIAGLGVDVANVGPAAGNGNVLTWDQAQNKWVATAPTAVDSTKLPLAGGTMTGALNMGGQNVLSVGHITMVPQASLKIGQFTNAQETGLIGGLTAPDEGKIWYNSDTNDIKLWNGSAATTLGVPAFTGDVTSAGSTLTIAQNAVTSAKINNAGIAVNRILITDATTGNGVTYATCNVDEVLKWNVGTGWGCAALPPAGISTTLASGQILVGNAGNLAGPVTLSGDVTLNNAGVLTLNTVPLSKGGTGATTAGGAFAALSPLTAKGDLLAHNGSTNVRLPAGTDGRVLVADSAQPSGLNWAIATSGDFRADGTVAMVSGLRGIGGAWNTPSFTFSTDNDTGIYNSGPGAIAFTHDTALSFTLSSGGLQSFTPRGASIKVPAGSAASPTYHFAGDAVTGMYSDTANFLGFSTNGTPRLVIDSVGNVGIGTASPQRPLHVNGSIRVTPGALPGAPASGDIAIDAGAGNSLKYFNGVSWVAVAAAGSGDNFGNHIATNNIQLGANFLSGDGGSEGIYVNAAGNVGFGTSTPATLAHLRNGTLTVEDSNSAGARVSLNATSTNGRDYQLVSTGIGGSNGVASGGFMILDWTNSKPSFVLSNNGRAGFNGVTSPLGALHGHEGSGAPNLVLDQYWGTGPTGVTINMRRARGTAGAPSAVMGGDTVARLGAYGYGDSQFHTTPGAAIQFLASENYTNTFQGTDIGVYTTPVGSASPSERVRVTHNGNVGIGTSAPASRLHVSENVNGPAAASVSNTFAGSISEATFQADNGTEQGAFGIKGMATGTIGVLSPGSTFVSSTSVLALVAGSPIGEIKFGTDSGNIERMRITTNGNVGIGTTSPGEKLHVLGPVRVEGQLITQQGTVPTGGIVDLNTGNTQVLQNVGGSSITLNNMRMGTTYKIIVADTASRAYTFSNCTVLHFSPSNGVTASGMMSMYEITPVDISGTTHCMITWVTGF